MNFSQSRLLRQPAQKRSMSASLRRLAAWRTIHILATGALLAISTHTALADSYAYTGGGAGTTTTPVNGNFNAGFIDTTTGGTTVVAPVSSSDTILTFSGGTAYTATDNIAGAFNLNNITSTISAAISIGTSSLSANYLNFGTNSSSVAPTITQNGTQTINLKISTKFGSNLLTVNGSGSGQVTIGVNGATLAASSTTTGTGGITDLIANQLTLAGDITQLSGTIQAGVTSGNSTIRIDNATFATGGSAAADFNLGNTTGGFNVISNRSTVTTTLSLGSLSGGTNTQLRGSDQAGAGLVDTYSIGARPIDTTFAGTIQNGTNAAAQLTAITKVGSNSLTLTNAGSTYSGVTTITGGNLVIINTTGTASATQSVTGTGAVNVSGGSSAVLSGTGTTAGTVTVTNSSVLAPGVNTPGTNFGVAGTLTAGSTGGVTLGSTGTAVLDFDLTSSAAGTNDLISTGGALNLGTISFTFNELNGSLDTTTPYTLISGATSATGFNASNISTAFQNGTTYTPTYSLNGNNLQVAFAAAPEPSQWVAFGLGMLGLGGLASRARRRQGVGLAA